MSHNKTTNIIVSTLVTLIIIAWSAVVMAQSVPNVVTFQSVLFDDSGNIITDDMVDVLFRIIDDQDNEIYAEEQSGVQVYDGMINVLVGYGVVPGSSPPTPTGGLTLTDLDPQTPLFLEVTVKNITTLEPLELTTVPYAFYAQQSQSVAKGAITSEMIADGAISINHFNETFMISDFSGTIDVSQLPSEAALDSEVATAVNNLQSQIDSNDTDIAGLSTQVGNNTSNITNLQSQISSNDTDITNLQNNKLTKDGTDSMTGDLNMGGQDITNVGTVDGVDVSSLGYKVCAISVHSAVVDDNTDDCMLHGISVNFGSTGTAMSGVASIINIQDDGVYEKSDQINVLAVTDNEQSKLLFLMTTAIDSNPAIGGLAIGTVPAGDPCPTAEIRNITPSQLRNKGSLPKGSCVVTNSDINYARSAL